MTEQFNPAEIGGEPVDPVVVDKRGTLMIERESYERVIEGLKQAADGAQHLTMARQDGSWRNLAKMFDNLRSGVARLGGLMTATQDAVPSQIVTTANHTGIHVAYDRVYRG